MIIRRSEIVIEFDICNEEISINSEDYLINRMYTNGLKINALENMKPKNNIDDLIEDGI